MLPCSGWKGKPRPVLNSQECADLDGRLVEDNGDLHRVGERLAGRAAVALNLVLPLQQASLELLDVAELPADEALQGRKGCHRLDLVLFARESNGHGDFHCARNGVSQLPS